jgi:hypothetical protein
MAADYAGALAAIRQRFVDNWTTTPIAYVNEPAEPAVDANGNPTTWVLFETVNSGSKIDGWGSSGNNTVVYYGMIKAHVFAPVNSGIADCYAKALAAGEIFRNKVFYDSVTTGCYVRSGYRPEEQPRIDEGDASSNDGQWFAVTATIPFEFWTRA